MTPERWRRIESILEQALEREGPARAAFVQDACGPDLELHQEVESFLAVDHEAGEAIAAVVGSAANSYHLEEAALSEGDRLGVYRIVREIGRGGMGAVYL